jgi:predicted NBD/HSP70 family sugar kinase
VLGAGIGAPGPLDLREGILLNVLSPPSWSHFPMRQAVGDALGTRVIMDNDATAAAMGEHWAGVGAGCDSFSYVYLGTGVGSGLVLRGQPYRGLRGNAGEIAHVQVDGAGPPCECGRNGCLGRFVTPDGLLREARRTALEAPLTDPLPDCPETVEQLAAATYPRLIAVVDTAGDHLGRVMTEISRILDPELIVLGGPLVAHVGEAFKRAVEHRLREIDEPGAPPPRVELSHIGSDAGVIGAATLILHDLYAPTAHKLSLAEPAREIDRRAA